jgi:hypothetical protein
MRYSLQNSQSNVINILRVSLTLMILVVCVTTGWLL